MSIITFWNKRKEQNGKTLSAVALATYTAIQHNYRILLISTSLNDRTMQKCYWKERRTTSGLFGPNIGNSGIQNGIEGLNRIVKSNKVSPELITNYTRVVFKDRLEVLLGYTGNKNDFKTIASNYMEIIKLADKYYDMVIIDLDKEIGEECEKNILSNSDIIVATMSQRLESINEFVDARKKMEEIQGKIIIPLITRYDNNSKYNVKNVSRNLLGQKDIMNSIPYNTFFFESAEEAGMVDFFLRMRNLKENDYNYFFINEIKQLSENVNIAIGELHSKK